MVRSDGELEEARAPGPPAGPAGAAGGGAGAGAGAGGQVRGS